MRLLAPERVDTVRLALRRLSPADAPELFRVVGDPTVMRYWAPGADIRVEDTARRIAAIQRHWEEHGFGDWGVVERSTGELIGFAGLHHIQDMAEVNVGYALRRDRWGAGYGTEVCRAALGVGFGELGLEEIVAVIAPQNAASRRLAERCGLSFWRELNWLGRARVVHRATPERFACLSGRVVTAGAYVVWRGRYVFMVGFPGDATDRLGVVRLGGHREGDEDAWRCAAREVLEESGLHLRPIPPPATYWIGPGQDERTMRSAPWEGDTSGGAAPLLVGWRSHVAGDGDDRDGGGAVRLSVTYVAEGLGDPHPAAETQGLLLLRPQDVTTVARGSVTLEALLDTGAEALLRAPLPTHLPLEPLTQLRALALLLDRHPSLRPH